MALHEQIPTRIAQGPHPRPQLRGVDSRARRGVEAGLGPLLVSHAGRGRGDDGGQRRLVVGAEEVEHGLGAREETGDDGPGLAPVPDGGPDQVGAAEVTSGEGPGEAVGVALAPLGRRVHEERDATEDVDGRFDVGRLDNGEGHGSA